MEYIIFIILIIGFSDISSKLKLINKKLETDSKTKYNLKELVGKNVVIEFDEDFSIVLEGKLISFDEKWFEIETVKKNKSIETTYKRISEIKSITIKNK
ncbi:MAG: hypothetical protein E7160_00885 [Firmicutes bacterium]|nr:hypothetical protein [Bacillota bacterium]